MGWLTHNTNYEHNVIWTRIHTLKAYSLYCMYSLRVIFYVRETDNTLGGHISVHVETLTYIYSRGHRGHLINLISNLQ